MYTTHTLVQNEADFIPDEDSETGEVLSPRQTTTATQSSKSYVASGDVTNEPYTTGTGKGQNYGELEDDCDDDENEEEGQNYDPSDDDNDQDDEEEEDVEVPTRPTNSISHEARKHVFPILINELIKESILVQSEGQLILELFKGQNYEVNHALDVYDRQHDMGILVESLMNIAQSQ